MNNFKLRAQRNLNLKDFEEISLPIEIKNIKAAEPNIPYQYILRMMIREKETFHIPEELMWLKETILQCDENQKANNFKNSFVYVTVRHGEVSSITDDDWHVDGFSMRIPNVPEQNYFYANCFATEYQEKAFPMPKDFCPLTHNMVVAQFPSNSK